MLKVMRKLGNHGDKNKPDSHRDSLEGGGIVLQSSHSHAHDMWKTSHRKNNTNTGGAGHQPPNWEGGRDEPDAAGSVGRSSFAHHVTGRLILLPVAH